MHHIALRTERRGTYIKPGHLLVLGIGVMGKDELFDSTCICFCNIPTSLSKGGGRRKGKVLRERKTILTVCLRGFYFKMISPKLQTLSLNLGGKQLFLCWLHCSPKIESNIFGFKWLRAEIRPASPVCRPLCHTPENVLMTKLFLFEGRLQQISETGN